jgi:YteA family regulatory protein
LIQTPLRKGLIPLLTQKQLTTLRNLLKEELENIKQRQENHKHYGLDQSSLHESLGELSSYDNHPGDQGSELFEREKDIALNEHTEQEAQDILRALQAMDQGNYGRCQICQAEIPYERLQAMPTTLRCIKHAEEKFVSQNRPIEEQVLRSSFGNFSEEGEDSIMYDAEDAWQDVAKYGTAETPSDFLDPEKFDYNAMHLESDEQVGYVEEIEGFLITDMKGKNVDVNTESPLHDEYEEYLDDAGVVSVLGNPDLLEDYTEDEGYVKKE